MISLVSVPFGNFFFYLFTISSSNGRHEVCTSFSGNASVPLGCLVTPAATERRRRQQMIRAPVSSGPLPWSACARRDQEHQRRLHGEALKWDEAQTWNCCHCDYLLHVVSQSVLVHGLAKWQRWVHLWDWFSSEKVMFFTFVTTAELWVQVLCSSSINKFLIESFKTKFGLLVCLFLICQNKKKITKYKIWSGAVCICGRGRQRLAHHQLKLFYNPSAPAQGCFVWHALVREAHSKWALSTIKHLLRLK